MKKSKLSITLVTSFIAAMALTACKDVTESKTAVVTFNTYDGQTVELITDNVYNKYRGTSNGISMFYEKILEVLIRWEFEHGTDSNGGKTGFDKGDMKLAEIENYAKNQVQEQKDKAKENAKNNKETSYKDEWESILDSYKVEDEEGLKQHFIYEKEKEVIKNWYAGDTDKAEELKKDFIGVDDSNKPVNQKEVKVKAAMPYHVRHILVKVDEASDSNAKFYKGTVTEAQAKLLANTVKALASGEYTFSEVAKMYSEDGSASSGGDVGIMTNAATSGSLGMVNEFQLGAYVYDNLFDEAHKADPNKAYILDGLGITTEGADSVSAQFANSLGKVPYESFVKIGDCADITTDEYGNKLANGSSTVYPRNILWNKYFNLHNIFLISNKKSAGNKFGADGKVEKEEFSKLITDADETNAPNTNRFNANGILVDEIGRPIICVRSQYGIHFMVIERSMYDYDEIKDPTTNEVIRSSLSDYYSTKLPGETGYTDDSYVGYIVSQSQEDYKTRANDVKSKITSFDPTYDYRLYQWLTSEIGTLTFYGNAEGLGDDINNYITALQNNNKFKQEEGLEKVWRTYDELLDVQEYNRSAMFDIVNPVTGVKQEDLTRLASEKIADDFIMLKTGKKVNGDAASADEKKDAYKNFAEGGLYYYYA